MKQIKNVLFICFILLLFSLSGYTQNLPSSLVTIIPQGNSFTITFNLQDYKFKDTILEENEFETFKWVEINDYFGIISDTGYPQLPQLTFDLHIPEDATEFQVSMSNIDTQHIIINRKILPFQERLKTDSVIFQINNAYYDSDGSLYNFTSQISDPYIVMGAKGISFSIFPFTYNPEENKIIVLNNATFVITYNSQGQPSSDSSEIKRKYLSKFFENYPYNPGSSYIFSGKYLIITAPEYENTLTYFANYKRNIGYTVDVVNTNATGTSAANIKLYLQQIYNNIQTRPDYVLLVGDHDRIPASEGNPSGEAINDPITDLKYARLDGNDYFADVFLGRFSVSNTSELQNIINKTIFMEMNMHRFDKKAKFIAGMDEDQKKQDKLEEGHDYVVDYTFIPQGYNCQKLYQPNIMDAIAAINDNPLFYIYSGHGSFIYLAGGSFSIYETNIEGATNTIFPFVFSFACKTGDFAYSEPCIGESFIRAEKKGGITYFGSSVNSYFNSDIAIEEKIFGDAFTDEDHISTIVNLGMQRYWQRFWSVMNRDRTKRYMKAYNLMGDPSINIHGIGCIDNFTFAHNEIFHSGDIVTYHADCSIRNNALFEIQSGADINLKAGNEIILQSGFHAAGGNFEAKIEVCNSNPVVMSLIPQKEEEKEENKTNTKELIIDPARFSIFPNPTKSEFSVSYTLDKNDFVKLDLYTLNGSKLKSLLNVNNQPAGNYYFNFSIPELSTGIYVLVFTSSIKKYTYKLIKN